MPSLQSNVFIEENVRFSQSCIWQMQREYYRELGVSAWADQVPFNVTSNVYIANTYANVVMAFIRDWLRGHPDALQHPFYLLELGSGHGRFSFYAIKRLCELLQASEISSVKICYLMSDFAKNNFDFWTTQPALQPYLEKGVLDFALFDVENDEAIQLPRSQRTLGAGELHNPLVVFANYVFDSIPQDCFRIQQGKLYEGLVSARAAADYEGSSVDSQLDKISLEYNYQPIENTYYQDELLDRVLFNYKNLIKEGTFIFPISALRTLQKLFKISNNRLLLLSSDKGHVAAEEVAKLDQPHVAFHHSISVMVNFHAIGEFFQQAQGNYFFQTPRRGIKTCAYYNGFSLAEMPQLNMAIETHLEKMSPGDYFTWYQWIKENHAKVSLEVLATCLNISEWDPLMFKHIHQFLGDHLNNADAVTIQYLKKNIDKLAANFYYLPRTTDTFLDMAILLHKMKEWQRATHYYQQSQKVFGENFSSCYNLGLCHFELGDLREAMCCFRRAWELNPTSQEATQWLQYIEKIRAESAA